MVRSVDRRLRLWEMVAVIALSISALMFGVELRRAQSLAQRITAEHERIQRFSNGAVTDVDRPSRESFGRHPEDGLAILMASLGRIAQHRDVALSLDQWQRLMQIIKTCEAAFTQSEKAALALQDASRGIWQVLTPQQQEFLARHKQEVSHVTEKRSTQEIRYFGSSEESLRRFLETGTP